MARDPNKQPRLFSKALFKQSYKANYVMWLIVTFAVCFTLSSVMVISGGSGIGKIKDSVQETIVEGVMESNIKKSGVYMSYSISDATTVFDETFVESFDQLNTPTNAATWAAEPTAEKFQQIYVAPSYQAGINAVHQMYPDYERQKIDNDTGKPVYDEHGEPVMETANDERFLATMVAINPNHQADDTYNGYYVLDPTNKYYEPLPTEDYVAQFTQYMVADVQSWSSESAAGTSTDVFLKSNDRLIYRDHRCCYATGMLVSIQFFEEKIIQKLIELLVDYGVTEEDFNNMGFTYESVHRLSYEAGLEFDEKCYYEFGKIEFAPGTPEYDEEKAKIRAQLEYEIGGSLLDKMPENVAQGLKEIGSLDIYSLLICSVFFKMAGLLLPIIYVIMVSNNLIAGQVDTGSMAYVLSTSTRRKQVTFTQGLFLVGSLVAMFACAAITGLISLTMVHVNTELTAGKLLLSTLNSFMIIFAIAGINYFTSCIYDRSRRAMAIGGGLSMFFLVATMLGLFGSPVIPSVIRIDTLNYFNYVSLMSLFDVISVLEGGVAWIWKCAILFLIGGVCFFLGARRFQKKDLPL